uniref:Uncharacterized protein n=1 Tax=Sphaerodactylus townsendi TaxID=933632 RepID=A0ACB8FDC4_9SAUR
MDCADYCASKFAAVGFLEALVAEMKHLKKTGIKATIVCPYFISTGMFEGCKSKLPHVIPVLKPEYTAEKIVTSVLREEFYVILPRFVTLGLKLKHWLPQKIATAISDYIGLPSLMDTFVGRQKKR